MPGKPLLKREFEFDDDDCRRNQPRGCQDKKQDHRCSYWTNSRVDNRKNPKDEQDYFSRKVAKTWIVGKKCSKGHENTQRGLFDEESRWSQSMPHQGDPLPDEKINGNNVDTITYLEKIEIATHKFNSTQSHDDVMGMTEHFLTIPQYHLDNQKTAAAKDMHSLMISSRSMSDEQIWSPKSIDNPFSKRTDVLLRLLLTEHCKTRNPSRKRSRIFCW